MTESVLPATRERSAGAAGPGALRKLDRALDLASSGIASICAGLIAVFLLGMVLAASFQVLSRYLISSLVGEPEEIARMAMVGMVFLALPVLARYSDHIRLDLAQETIKSAVLRKWIVRLVLVAELLFLAVLTVLAWSLWNSFGSRRRSPLHWGCDSSGPASQCWSDVRWPLSLRRLC